MTKTKITKTEYHDEMNKLKDGLQATTNILENFSIKYSDNMDQYFIDYSENMDYWNQIHDAQYDIEKQIDELESRWSKRNWTHQDWVQWDMITSNID